MKQTGLKPVNRIALRCCCCLDRLTVLYGKYLNSRAMNTIYLFFSIRHICNKIGFFLLLSGFRAGIFLA